MSGRLAGDLGREAMVTSVMQSIFTVLNLGRALTGGFDMHSAALN